MLISSAVTSYCTADLGLCFLHEQKSGFLMTRLILYEHESSDFRVSNGVALNGCLESTLVHLTQDRDFRV